MVTIVKHPDGSSTTYSGVKAISSTPANASFNIQTYGTATPLGNINQSVSLKSSGVAQDPLIFGANGSISTNLVPDQIATNVAPVIVSSGVVTQGTYKSTLKTSYNPTTEFAKNLINNIPSSLTPSALRSDLKDVITSGTSAIGNVAGDIVDSTATGLLDSLTKSPILFGALIIGGIYLLKN